MADIAIEEQEDLDLAVFTVTGTVTAEDIIAVAEGTPGINRSRHLVDMRAADFHLLDSVALSSIAAAFSASDRMRPAGRTAVVVTSSMNATIVRLFAEISAGKTGSPVVFKITTSRAEALNWLAGAAN